jgi:prevent-host-death family protein
METLTGHPQEDCMSGKAAKRTPVIRSVPVSEARARFGALIRRVQNDKECVVLERAGTAVAALVDIDEFEDYLELHDPDMTRVIAASHQDYLAGRTRPAEEFLAELQADADKGRARGRRVKSSRSGKA